MAPKKKGNKKNDDWEADLGETPETATTTTQAPEESVDAGGENEANPDDEFPAGGLMAMMRKKQKKNKKNAQNDFLEGEAPPDASVEGQDDLAGKQAVEASIDDEFALPEKKGKGGKKETPAPAKDEDEGDDDTGADGKVLTKAQKEKLKKEREKQRKKENVSFMILFTRYATNHVHRLRRRRLQEDPQPPQKHQNQKRLSRPR
jgi:translation initiation factor 5B